MRTTFRRLFSIATLLLPLFSTAVPVINEIMYRPGAGYPEDTSLEFIELHNPGLADVDVEGWAITSGVDFTLPAGASIPAGGFLVVAADVAAFQAAHPSVTNVHGPWAAGSGLSDKGETITLSQPGATPGAWTTVDSVSYADEGDWAATRTWDTTNGFLWSAGANGAGKSLERRNPNLVSDNGQAWGDSTAVGGSPGAANSLLAANIAPIIRKVNHWPAVPKSTEAVTISCELRDELAAGSLSATLYWRDATGTSPAAFTAQAMSGNGTGYFSSSLPARANKTVIEFYVSATDGTLTRVWPASTSVGQTANCLYQVDDEVITGIHAAYRLVMTGSENSAYTTVAATSNRQFHMTFISSQGDKHVVRYRTSIRNRGNTSRNWTIRPARVSFPTDDLWDGVSDFNINSKYPYCQYLGMRCVQLAGLAGSDATPIEVRRNGVEYTVTGTGADFGKLVRVEELNGDYIDNHWPDAPSGNLYRAETMNGTQWVSTGAAPATPNALWNGWSKENGSGENDWTDIINFSTVWQNTAASHFTGATAGNVAAGTWNNVAFSDAEVATLSTVCDFDQMARFLAVFAILQNTEQDITSGYTDDYAAAWIEDTLGQRRMNLVPYDQDNNLGKGDSAAAYNASGLYNMTESGAIFEPLLPLIGNSTTPGNAAFRAKYLLEIRKLYGGLFDADTTGNPNPPFHRFLDNHVGAWVDAATLASLKTFATQRQAHILGLIGQPKIAPAPTSTGTFATPLNPVVRINEVLASNLSAYANGATFPDVIELHNAGGIGVDLTDLSLTDDPAVPRKFVFPAGTILPAGGFLLVHADSATAEAGMHSLFALDAKGEQVSLYDSPANGGGLLDEVVFGPQPDNLTLSRTAADPSVWALTAPTLNGANGNALALGAVTNLRLNEWAGNTNYRLNRDFVELYNKAATPIAIGNVRLTDDIANHPTLQVFPPLSFLAANGFLLLNEDDLGFTLDANFGYVTLTGENGELIDQVSIDSQFGDRSTGRTTDGADTYSQFALPTPGFSNATVAPARYADLLSLLRITEIMAEPTGGNTYEFVELQNIGATSLDLGGVRFSNGIDYTFPSGTSLAAGAFLVVCKDRVAFLDRHPGAAAALADGAYTGALDNAGENLRLSLPGAWDVHILNFDYDPDWYALTASSGYSLTTINAATSLAADWDEPFTWSPSAIPQGTPGSDGPPSITSAGSATAVLGDAFNYQITATRFPSSYSASGLPPGLELDPATGLIRGAPSATGVFSAILGATNAGGTSSATVVFTINSSGPLAGFTWDYLPASTPAQSPFAVKITARDAAGRVVASFNDAVTLSGSVTTGAAGSPVVITEMTDAAQDQFELQNVTDAAVNTSGWYVKVSDSGNNSNINAVGATQFALPASLAAGGMVWATEQLPPPVNATAFGAPINWSSTGSQSKGWIMLFDGANTLRDFLLWGWSPTDLNTLNITVNGVNITGTTLVSGGHWSGAGVTTPGANIPSVIKRRGTADTNTAADFTNTTTGANFLVTNVGLTLPWARATPVVISPVSASFTNGVYIGTETAAAAAEDAVLRAVDGASGNGGNSAAIDITAALVDGDGDGMPDAWESVHSVVAPGLDDDDDGMTNLQEYRAGTLPDNDASRLVLSEAGLTGAALTLAWPGVSGKIYRICGSPDLSNWTPASPLMLVTEDGEQRQTVHVDAGDPLYFRAETVP